MNLQFYLEKLFVSEEFEKFKREKPEAFFCSGFFVLNGENKVDKVHIDYFNPETEKMFSFQLESDCQIVPIEQISGVPVKIADNVDVDFEKIKELVLKEMEVNKVKNKIEKILLSLQTSEGRNFLIGTVFISGLGLLKVKINLDENKVDEFEKKSFFDMMKVMKK